MAATALLGLFDHDHHTQSRTSASAHLGARITDRKWVGTAASMHDPLGAIEGRKVGAVKLSDRLPDAPDGRYAVIGSRTSFTDQKNATETVVMKDGHRTCQAPSQFLR